MNEQPVPRRGGGDMRNADRIQSVLTDNLFPTVEHISDVKQVLELMQQVGQSISEEQIRAAVLLESLGNNKRLHPDGNPYKWLVDNLIGKPDKPGIWKMAVVPVGVYLDTIEELIPKPPKPVIVAPGAAAKGVK